MTPVSFGSPPPPELAQLAPLAGWARELAQAMVAVAADVALVVDADGVIQHLHQGSNLVVAQTKHWVGRPWADTVTDSTRRKVEMLLAEVRQGGVTRRREVNHPPLDAAPGALDIPVAYTAIQLGTKGPVLAVGKDLRTVAAIQQRFVEASQSMERDYWAQRKDEVNSQALVQVATDAVLLLDAQTLHVVQANGPALALLALGHTSELAGLHVRHWVHPAQRQALEDLLTKARSSASTAVLHAHTNTPVAQGLEISATPLHSSGGTWLLVRMSPQTVGALGDTVALTVPPSEWAAAQAVAITDSAGRVLVADDTLAQWCNLSSAGQAQGQHITQLLGDPQHHLAQLLAQSRQMGLAQGLLHLVSKAGGGDTSDRLGKDQTVTVEACATLLADADQARIGLVFRQLRAVPADPHDVLFRTQAQSLEPNAIELKALLAATSTRAFDQLNRHLGQQPLAQLMQAAALVAERQFIAAAMARHPGDPDAAAKLLGLELDQLQLRCRALELPTLLYATGPNRH